LLDGRRTVQLVEVVHKRHGDILVLDMGEPVRILNLAHSLLRLANKSPREVEVKFIGLREGEKLREELFYSEEEVLPTNCDKIRRVHGAAANWLQLDRQLARLHAAMRAGDGAEIRARVREIVPEYCYSTNGKQPSAATRPTFLEEARPPGSELVLTAGVLRQVNENKTSPPLQPLCKSGSD
jgi:FlaA1/EpsC-like NDP-sugar epimerase